MKKIFTPGTKRILPLLILIVVQAKAWALETTTNTTINKSTNIFSHPWIWIAIIVVSLIVLIGPFHDAREYRVIMKKKAGDRKR